MICLPGIIPRDELPFPAIPDVTVRIGSSPSDSTFYFYYPFNNGDRLMYDYRTNRSAFDAIDSLLRTPSFIRRIEAIEITGNTCPIGTAKANRKIAHQRAETLAGWLRYKYPELSVLSVPIRCSVNGRLFRLFTETLGFSHDQAYRQLRSATLRFILLPDSIPLYERTAELPVEAAPAQTDSAVTRPTSGSPLWQDAVWEAPSHVLPSYRRVPLLAVKTNLLYDLSLTPNLGIEIPLGKRWSVSGEFLHGWWLKRDNTFCWQLETLGVEGRYWFGDRRERRVLTGWFAGAFAGIGVYDFQLKRDRGIQGDFYISAGLSGGYAMQLGSSPWGLTFALGAGYLTTDYTRYRIDRDKLVRHGAQMRFSGIVPLKAEISLMYLLQRKKKGGDK